MGCAKILLLRATGSAPCQLPLTDDGCTLSCFIIIIINKIRNEVSKVYRAVDARYS